MRKRKARRAASGADAVAPKSAPRIVVSYVDRTWTDRLAARRVELLTHAQEISFRIEIASRASKNPRAGQDALREFVAKRGLVETLQIGKRSLAALLRERLRETEDAELSVHLTVNGQGVVYPASVVFGPDAITLTLG